MKTLLITLCLIGLFGGCKKDQPVPDNACTATNPLDVQWVKEITQSFTNCTCKHTLFQGTYRGQTVFFSLMNDPLCDGIFSATLHDCTGNVIRSYPSSLAEMEAFSKEVKIEKPLYVCKK